VLFIVSEIFVMRNIGMDITICLLKTAILLLLVFDPLRCGFV